MISVDDSSPIKLAFKEKNVNVQEEFTTDIVTQCPTGDCKQCAGSCQYSIQAQIYLQM
jgi:hypothetical protein